MATILSLKRRIQAARNVSKTTRAMQMISASKLKKAQDAAVSTRPYVSRLEKLTKRVVSKLEEGNVMHPYIKTQNAKKKTLMIVVAPDKGLCGGLITNLLKKFLQYNKENKDAYYIVVGKKLENQVARAGGEIIASFPFGTITPAYDAIYPVMKIIDEYYLEGKVDEVKVLYTEFTNFFSQSPIISKILPVKLNIEEYKDEMSAVLYQFEPSAEEILPNLIRHQIEMSLYHYYLESFASEQASRMITMQNATNNANDIIEDLRLEYNKTRQEKITSELLDITGGGVATA